MAAVKAVAELKIEGLWRAQTHTDTQNDRDTSSERIIRANHCVHMAKIKRNLS